MQLPEEPIEPADTAGKSTKEDPEDPLPEEFLPKADSAAEDDAPVVQKMNNQMSSMSENADNDDELPIAALLQLESDTPRRMRARRF